MIISKSMKIVATITALSGGAVATWPVISYSELYPVLAKSYRMDQSKLLIAQNELKEQLEDVGRTLLHLRYMSLKDEREAKGFLSFNDQQELCRLAKVLDYHPTPGCV